MAVELDHLVICAATLEAGVDHVRACLSIEMPPGGRHPLMGTHNRVVRLGADSFLEVIAPDPEAAAPGRPRWFGLDDPPAVPRLAHWVVRRPAWAAAEPDSPDWPDIAGPAIPVTRGDLRWTLTVPDSGVLPEGGVFPSLIAWEGATLPPRAMPDLGLELNELRLWHPDPDHLRAQMSGQVSDPRVTLRRGEAPALEAWIGTPQGLRHLA